MKRKKKIFPHGIALFFIINLSGDVFAGSHSTLQGCESVLRVQPNLDLDNIFEKQKELKLQIKVNLKQNEIEKGCGRSGYNDVSLYHNCGVGNILQLLPTQQFVEEQHLKHLPSKLTSRGGRDYIFDGGTAVRFPTKQLPHSWYEKYTLAGWIYASEHNDRQYILSWSGGDSPRRDNSGFYVKRGLGLSHMTFGFHHTHIDETTGNKCVLKKKWKLFYNHSRVIWNFVSFSFSSCDAQLTVNGHHLPTVSGQLHYHEPGKHIQPKFVIGARWTGSVQKYNDYFNGRISGLMLKAHENVKLQHIQCILTCKEKLKLASSLPKSFTEAESYGQLVVEGVGSKKEFQALLHDIIYVNTEHFPEQYHKLISIEVKNEKQVTKDVLDVGVSRKQSTINIAGECSSHNHHSVVKHGIRVCTNMKIWLAGCTQVIDSVALNVKPPLNKNEKLFIPAPFLKRHKLSSISLKDDLLIYGIAGVTQYNEILRHLKYSHTGFINGKLTRTIYVTATTRNGLVRSNTFEISFTVSDQGFQVMPLYLHSWKTNSMKADVAKGKFIGVQSKLPAVNSNKSTQQYIPWIVGSCVLASIAVVMLVGFGVRRHRSSKDIPFNSYVEKRGSIPSEYFWDEEGLPMRLTINPSERVSITNDPYTDILSKIPYEGSTTDGSMCSDEEETNCDTDSIRQLEWDCLENSLDSILQEDKDSRLKTENRDTLPKEIYL